MRPNLRLTIEGVRGCAGEINNNNYVQDALFHVKSASKRTLYLIVLSTGPGSEIKMKPKSGWSQQELKTPDFKT